MFPDWPFCRNSCCDLYFYLRDIDSSRFYTGTAGSVKGTDTGKNTGNIRGTTRCGNELYRKVHISCHVDGIWADYIYDCICYYFSHYRHFYTQGRQTIKSCGVIE